MSIEKMFGELDKIDILAETKTGEVLMVLVCNGFIDGSPETQKALLDKMEGYLNHTQSEEFQKEYGDRPVILRVTLGRELLTEAVRSVERASQNDKVEKWCKES